MRVEASHFGRLGHVRGRTVPLEILHCAAPCRNVPVTFTLNRMHHCPHCGVQALPNMAVRWSYRESPAKCGHCGKLSHVIASTSNGIASVGLVMAVLSVLAGLVLESWFAAIAGLGMVAVHNILAWRGVELLPISE